MPITPGAACGGFLQPPFISFIQSIWAVLHLLTMTLEPGVNKSLLIARAYFFVPCCDLACGDVVRAKLNPTFNTSFLG